MKNYKLTDLYYPILILMITLGISAQAKNPIVRGKPINPKTTVIIDYIDSFNHHRTGHGGGGGPGGPPGGGGGDSPDDTHKDGHFELIGGIWVDADNSGVVDPALAFIVDIRGFSTGSSDAIVNAFNAWENETEGVLFSTLAFEDVAVVINNGVNTYSMRNLGGGGVLAATFITWHDANNNDDIDPEEIFLEMDVIHNSIVKWGTDGFTPKGKWWDVESVAVHEIGHVYGLAHPGNAHAEDEAQTMFASAPPKKTDKRSLESDGDVKGIQSTFLGYGAQ